MYDPVETDLRKYELRLEAEDQHDACIDERTQDRFNQYWAEYLSTGEIKELDLDEANLELEAQELNIRPEYCHLKSNIAQVVWNEAREMTLLEWD